MVHRDVSLLEGDDDDDDDETRRMGRKKNIDEG
jgi:hypothetical protein